LKFYNIILLYTPYVCVIHAFLFYIFLIIKIVITSITKLSDFCKYLIIVMLEIRNKRELLFFSVVFDSCVSRYNQLKKTIEGEWTTLVK